MRVDRSQFGRLLHHIGRCVEGRNTIPILGHVRLVNKDNRLTATATDLDIEITSTIEAEGDDAAFCVDAKMLAGIVGKLSGDTVDIDPTDGRATIKAGRSRFTLDTLPVADFPEMTAGAFPVEFDIDLAALVAPVQFAISNEATRYYLNGVYLHVDGGHIVAVATDGHRLARHEGDKVVTDAGPLEKGVILPRKTVSLLPKGTVKFAVSDTKVRIVADDVTIVSKLIDGTFPDYKRVIPTGNDKIVTVDNAALRAAAERVAVVSVERERGLRLAIANNEIELTIRGEGEAVDVVGCTYDGDAIEVGFNAGYLAELVGTFPPGDVQMALADGGSPVVFTGSAEGLLCVLMPRRV